MGKRTRHSLKLNKILNSKPTCIIVENKDRLTRFGFNYLKTLLEQQDCKIIVINETQEAKQIKEQLGTS